MGGAVVKYGKQFLAEFKNDEAAMRSAAIAYFAALSLAPMILLFVSAAGMMGESTQQNLIDTVVRTIGEQPGEIVRQIADQDQAARDWAGVSMVIGIAVLLYAASKVLQALQVGLNRIWDVRVDPDAGWTLWIRKRLLSMAMVMAIGFLLLVSMIVTTAIDMTLPAEGWLWNLITLAISFLVYIVLFAGLFKFLPDVRISWKCVWIGATVTAGLFAIGKHLVGLYLSNATFSDPYGAAGSLILLLVWSYFSSLIVFIGAEATQIYAREMGLDILPDAHAVRLGGKPAQDLGGARHAPG